MCCDLSFWFIVKLLGRHEHLFAAALCTYFLFLRGDADKWLWAVCVLSPVVQSRYVCKSIWSPWQFFLQKRIVLLGCSSEARKDWTGCIVMSPCQLGERLPQPESNSFYPTGAVAHFVYCLGPARACHGAAGHSMAQSSGICTWQICC